MARIQSAARTFGISPDGDSTMIIDQGPQQCARNGCACEVPAGQTYCSPHCANASVETEPGSTSCACGHGSCNEADREARANIEA
jgi:hypothetical protein